VDCYPQEVVVVSLLNPDVTTLSSTMLSFIFLDKANTLANVGKLSLTLLHIVPFCEGPNEKPEGFAKQKQPVIFAMRHASQLMVHHPSLIYNVPYNHCSTFATYTTNKTLRPT
jgi:hypothetical protein